MIHLFLEQQDHYRQKVIQLLYFLQFHQIVYKYLYCLCLSTKLRSTGDTVVEDLIHLEQVQVLNIQLVKKM